MKLSLLQWNVLYLEKAENILQLIRTVNADILCLQELTNLDEDTNPGVNIVESISKLGYQTYYEKTIIEPGFEMGNAIFSRLPFQSAQFYPTHESSGTTAYDDENRYYLEAALQIKNRLLYIGTAHLSYVKAFKPTEMRKIENDKFLSYVRRHNEAYIFSGDFNATPNTELIKTLANEFDNASPSFEQKTWTTKPFSYDGFEANTLDWRLDYIFCTHDIKVVSSSIVDTAYSDHLPILVEIEI